MIGEPGVSGIVLVGEPGVGKTVLARAALSEAERQGLPTAWVPCSRARSHVPFSALAHLGPADHDAPESAQFHGFLSVLLRRADRGRLVIGVDHAHLLDAGSAAVLEQVAATAPDVFYVVTVPAAVLAPEILAALGTRGVVHRLEVRRLDREEVEDLVVGLVGGHVEGATLYRLWTWSEGNPMFLDALVRGGLEAGTLERSDDVWSWNGPLVVPLQEDVVEASVASLTGAERDVIEVVALAEPVSARLLEDVTDPEAAESVERKGLITASQDARRVSFRLWHPMLREVLRAHVPVLRSRTICRRLAAAMEATGLRRQDDILRLVTFQLDSGVPVGPDLLVRGARDAAATADHGLAERLQRAAVDLGVGFPARHALSEALVAQGRHHEAELLLAELERDAADDRERAQASVARARNLFGGMRQREEALLVVDGAKRALSDTAALAELVGLEALLRLHARDPRAAFEAASAVLSLKDAGSLATLRAAAAASAALAVSGRVEEGAATADDHLQSALRLRRTEPLEAAELMMSRSLALWLSGRLLEAHQMAEQLYGLSLAQNLTEFIGVASALVGRVALATGRARAATQWLRDGASLLRRDDRFDSLPWCLANLAHAVALLGDTTGASSALRESVARGDESRTSFLDVDRALATAGVEASSGQVGQALQLASSAAEQAASRGEHGLEALAWHEVVRLGGSRRALARLAELHTAAAGAMTDAFVRHGSALAAQDASDLEEVSRRFEDLGADLLAAEAASEAAAAYRGAGAKARARSCQLRSSRLADACEGAASPVLTALRQPDVLTPREREVATLAASGMSSKGIAQRLVLSRRTIDNHLYKVYQKLGISNRPELVLALGVTAGRGRPSALQSPPG